MESATFTIHDQPSILLDHDRQQELLTAAKAKKGERHNDDDIAISNASLKSPQRRGSIRAGLVQGLSKGQSAEQGRERAA